MKKRTSFILKISGIVFLSLGLLSLTGIYAYRSFSDIIIELSETTRPDQHLIVVKSLMNDITKAENQVKTYSLTKDTSNLNNFYSLADQSRLRIEKLKTLSDNDSVSIDIDSLENLVKYKLDILNDLVNLRNNIRVQIALDKVVENLEKSVIVEKKIKPKSKIKKEEEKERKTLLEWFRGKKKSEEIELAEEEEKEEETKEEIVSISDVNREIAEVKNEERGIEISLRVEELSLILEDRKVTNKINALVNEYEIKEAKFIQYKAQLIKASIDNVNNQIVLFCIALGALLMLLTFLIYQYVQSNIKFRKALRNAKSQAIELAKTKERFLANMSHEIRTPMNAIAGFTEQLSNSELNESQKNQMKIVRNSIDHLQFLINDILDITKLQAGKLKLESIKFSLKDILNEVLEYAKPIKDDKEVDLKVQFDKNIPDQFKSDPYRLRQILLNVISNALKFTDKGQVLIHVSCFLTNDVKTKIRFEIIDTGIGIEQHLLNKIFDEFEQGESNKSRLYGGSGLGLSITKMLVDLFNGQISLKSKKGHGTEIQIEIPMEIASQEDEKPKMKKTSKTKDLPIKTVLIVDDEPYNRMLLKAIFKKHNVLITEAQDGKIAIDELNKNNYDLILMDARMPKLDGIKATEIIRNLDKKKKKDSLVIMLTAAVTKSDIKKYYKAGVDGVLAKPFKENELIEEIEKSFNNKNVFTEATY